MDLRRVIYLTLKEIGLINIVCKNATYMYRKKIKAGARNLTKTKQNGGDNNNKIKKY
jgi:hypothetical protein